MCGIMGYIGFQEGAGIVYDGLKKLEYRGYDSAGIATIEKDEIKVVRSQGKLSALDKKLNHMPLRGGIALGHTRWATHGKPSDENAHPHRSTDVVVVHNGIIENHLILREKLIQAGYEFQSETDSEILPFLIQSYLGKERNFETAVVRAIADLKGSFAFVALCRKEPDIIIAAKNSSPLIVGLGDKENFLASDIPAVLDHTKDVIVIEDGEIVLLSAKDVIVKNFSGEAIAKKVQRITWSRIQAEKEGYKHFMLKEIHEQPRAIADSLLGRISSGSNQRVLLEGLSDLNVQPFDRILITACGTSYHAAMVAKFWYESWLKIPVEVDLASEFRYRNPIVNKNTLVIVISQSGETADTLAAIEEAKRLGSPVVAICNVIDSSIARKATAVLYTQAGPEIGVASTKAFTTQLVVLALLGLYLGEKRDSLDSQSIDAYLSSLSHLPKDIEQILKLEPAIEAIAQQLSSKSYCTFLGRGTGYPIAMEGALKLKEISYIHAQAYAAGEMKHGPIALIDHHMPVIVLASGGPTLDKVVSNAQEVHARGAQLISVISDEVNSLESDITRISNQLIRIPPGDFVTRPILEVVPLQILSYHVADKRGTDVDQPRNLAKSVTVE